MSDLAELLRQSPYQGYAYAYPHKTAYRRLPEAVPLRDVWRHERRDALFLYVHVPFCEMRCGFCNLFTKAQPEADVANRYLATLRREVSQVGAALGEVRFARFAIGGGTPTFLETPQLETLFDLAEELGVERGRVPISVETSPATAEAEKLALLRERGVTRVSIGIQSFVEAEVKAVGRPQTNAEAFRALENLRGAHFPAVNIDLIYGLPGQTVGSWLFSVEQALEHAPQELFLYPLYVRPLTGLGRSGRSWDDQRLSCYREGRALLVSRGYEQISMRMFRAGGTTAEAPTYCCQEDGMVGVGCGARSYTRGLHYAREFAVGAQGVRAILADYLDRPDAAFAVVDYGFRLNADEQRRRFIVQSLLHRDGLNVADYGKRFGSVALADFPELAELEGHELAKAARQAVTLTARGMELSDTVGPWLYSARVRGLMESFDLR